MWKKLKSESKNEGGDEGLRGNKWEHQGELQQIISLTEIFLYLCDSVDYHTLRVGGLTFAGVVVLLSLAMLLGKSTATIHKCFAFECSFMLSLEKRNKERWAKVWSVCPHVCLNVNLTIRGWKYQSVCLKMKNICFFWPYAQTLLY